MIANSLKTKPEYLTRRDLASLLDIDISTVHNWSKRGILNPYGIGGRVYYKRSEVEAAIIELKPSQSKTGKKN